MLKQATLVFQKNFKIFIQEKQWRSELMGPIICYLFLQAAKSSDDPQLKQSCAQFLPMSLLTTCRSITTMMISDKSERQKEIQKIMGLKQSGYVLGWLMTNLARVVFVSTFFLALTISTHTLIPDDEDERKMSYTQTIVSYYMYAMALLALSYFLSVPFDKPKTGGDVCMLLNILGSISSQLMAQTYFQENNWIIYLLSLVPSFAYNTIPYIQISQIVKVYDYTLNDYFLMLGVDMLVYTLMYIYLDQVFPNEYGTNKHPLFMLGFTKHNQVVPGRHNEHRKSIDLVTIKNPLIQVGDVSELYDAADHSSAPYHEEFVNHQQHKKAVFIDDLRKTFDNGTKAVDGVTISIYDSQILCLLGHNGAGKTTTLSLLIGLIKKDSGQIYFNGQSADLHLDEIRSYIGICPQKDVLYDCLTVEEHLWYYGKIKGVVDQELNDQIEATILKCQLDAERGKIAKNLSGGNRRKLCLAMALIGNSRVIFLDEPTSGMDPVTRRKIWDILIQLKADGKSLVLTTHHLDEAEVLSERVAIMAKGKLLCVGSVDFVKKNFGIGYHLNLYNVNNTQEDWDQKSIKLKQVVSEHVPAAKYNPQTAKDCMSFQLPFDQKESLLGLFGAIENDASIQINLMMNTLEEAFINIGMDEEAFLKKTQNSGSISQVVNEPVEEEQQADLNDEFNKIDPPECLSRPPEFIFGSQLYACILRKVYGMQGKRLVVKVSTPKEDTFKDHEEYMKFWQIISSITTYGEIIFGISIASSSVGGVPVLERQLKQKYAMNVMGCRILPYWLGSYIYDTLVSMILVIFYIVIIFALQQDPLQTVTGVVLVFCCFAAYNAQAYALSWLFSDFLFAIRVMSVMSIFIFYITPFLLFLLVDSNILRWILVIIFPSQAFFAGFCAEYLEIFTTLQWPFILILIGQALIYFSITLIIDSRNLLAAVSSDQPIESNDADVLNEAKRVDDYTCSDRVIARKITKTYGNGFQAVKGTSFGVEAGSIFGLLGPNGAGKSTTFNMITSRLKPTNGVIYLEGQEIAKGKGDIYQNVGICPQFDSLFELLTPVHHLRIWAYLKGLKGDEIEQSIQYFLQVMQLKDYVKTQAQQLSGGNKRKLCVALALIGGTNMQFFDEPSSGVDPIARRYLWNSIQQGLKLRQSAVMLTTHTMDEAESLCSKLAIQINGKFACIGTPQSLKRKFGEGYRVSLNLTSVDDQIVARIEELMKQQFPEMLKLPETGYAKLTYKLPQEGFRFYDAFSFFLLKLQKEHNLITDFQINQTTLEAVFMYFASQQEEIEREALGNKKRAIFKNCCGNDEDD